jgi:hypothetical protein
MSVEHLEVLVEEPSMEAALNLLLPKMINGVSFAIHVYQGKRDLLKKLPGRLAGYAGWIPNTYRILVLLDRDDDNCKELKAKLETVADSAGLRTKSKSKREPFQVLNRLAIEELEAWYFGDWRAVRAAFPRVDAAIVSKAKYRNPDAIPGGTWETFERVLKQAGYFKNGLQKIKAAQSIAEHMVPARNESRSFQVLREALQDMVKMSPRRATT